MIDPDDGYDTNDEYEEEEDDDAQNDDEEEEDINYAGNQELYEEIAARTRTEFVPGVYKHAINKRFPIAKRGFLPIVAEDYTYTMDIMFMSVVLGKNSAMNKIVFRQTRGIPIVEGHGQVGDTPPVIGGLVLVETTSRKIFFYKLHSKDPREVLYEFKQFLSDVMVRLQGFCQTEEMNMKGSISTTKTRKNCSGIGKQMQHKTITQCSPELTGQSKQSGLL